MKSNTIDFTEEYDDLIKIVKFARFLIKLKVPGATELASDADDMHSDTFCGDCTSHLDSCECGAQYRGEYDDGADYYD